MSFSCFLPSLRYAHIVIVTTTFLSLVLAVPQAPTSSGILSPLLSKPSTTPTPLPVQRFPRNVHATYDGTWSASGALSFRIMPPKDWDAHSHAPSSLWNHFTSASFDVAMEVIQALEAILDPANMNRKGFKNSAGFTSFIIDSERWPVHSNLDVVFGNLDVRDGALGSRIGMSLQVAALYERSTGTLFVVGDILYERTENALGRLYSAFIDGKQFDQSTELYSGFTRDVFVQRATPIMDQQKSKFDVGGDYLSAVDPRSDGGILGKCPFIGRLAITPGNYDDSDSESDENANFINNIIGSNSAGTQNFATSSDNAYEQSGPLTFSLDGQTVEMKGRLSFDLCHTKMSIVVSTEENDTLFGEAVKYTLLVAVVAVAQIILLIRQMEATSSQASTGRISLVSVGMQVAQDIFFGLVHMAAGIAVPSLFFVFTTAAFFYVLCVTVYLIRWMILIWKARHPSAFSDDHDATFDELSKLFYPFGSALLTGVVIMYVLQDHGRVFVFGLSSFWIPQIILNAFEDHRRRSLLPAYIILTSVSRVAIPLYFWLNTQNFLNIQPQPMLALCLVCWMFVQCAVLISQCMLGPQWFMPSALIPAKYNYFRHISLEDEGFADLEDTPSSDDEDKSIGNNRSTGRKKATRQCCICIENVDVHSKERMVTPCNHFFHAACLEKWLEVRQECALCRSPLPLP